MKYDLSASVLMVPDIDPKFPSLGGQLVEWIQSNLCFGPGDLRGQPAVVDAEKRALIWRMYEVFPQGHPMAGRRRFKRVGVSLPKGLAKTELAAWLAAAELHPDAPVRCTGWNNGEPVGGPVTDPFITLVAYTEEQSDELAYGALRAILEDCPAGKAFDIGLERIVRLDGAGKAVSLASSPSARDGARTTFSIADETHWWTLPRLKQAHQTMQANLPKRKAADAWAIEITTAPEPGAGSVAEGTMEYAAQVRAGKVKDASLFFFHRQASDEHDLETEDGFCAAVIEASGSSAAWRDIESIVGLWRDPTSDRSYLERVYCNRLVKGSLQAFNVPRWRALQSETVVPLQAPIALGFDGSQFRDSTALVATHLETGFQWLAGLWECPPGHDGKDGRPKWQVPADEVDATVRQMFEQYTVVRAYFDPPYWQEWIGKWRGAFGKDRVIDWWTARRRPMTSALEQFETAINAGTISHSGDERLARHIGNARRKDLPQRDEDGNPLWLIQKERHDSPHKIDAAMAAILSWDARSDAIGAGALATPEPEYQFFVVGDHGGKRW